LVDFLEGGDIMKVWLRFVVFFLLLGGLVINFYGCGPKPGDEDTPKKMEIEYDYQSSPINCDVFPNGPGRLYDAFGEANTEVYIFPDSTNLTQVIPGTYGLLMYYIQNRYDSLHTMYFIGIADQQPRDYRIENAYGITVNASGIPNSQGPYAYSVIFSNYIVTHFSGDPYNWSQDTINDLFDLAVTHELGHQRGGLSDYDPNNPGDHVPGSHCVMIFGIPVDENGNYVQGYYSFCDNCKNVIKNVTWRQGGYYVVQ
jgi:hypothetical protein